MEKSNKGIERHESLYALSHHHHHGLVLALRLRRAGTEKSKMGIDEIVDQLRQFWEQGGQEHFRDEEEILLPAFSLYASIDEPVIAEMLLEHVHLRARIEQILAMEDTAACTSKLRELGNLLEMHIRKEERVIFPMVEEALPESVLTELEARFHAH